MPDRAAVVRAADGYSDTDFGLLCAAAAWFRVNSDSGLTPRQVPIEGLHAKWLNTHRPLVMALAIPSASTSPTSPRQKAPCTNDSPTPDGPGHAGSSRNASPLPSPPPSS
ncbi:DUF3322 domain-containing protein [Nonomuraea wenchangensis]